MRCPALAILAASTAAAALCGCVVIKQAGSPDPGRRDNIDERAGDAFRAGISMLDDVLLALGEPDDAAADGRWVEYRSVRNLGHWSFFGCGAYTCGGFDTEDKIRYRTLTVFFDTAGRVREIINVDTPAFLSPESRLLERKSRAATGPGEGIVERLPGAQWRVADHWRAGALVVTERAIVFLESGDTGPLYREALRLPAAEIQSVGWADGTSTSGGPCATVRRVDGSSEAFALERLAGDSSAPAPGFDPERTQHFIDIAGWLRSLSSRKPP